MLTIARACRAVTGVFSQPAVLTLEDGHYTPDTLVIKSKRRIWLECKSAEELRRRGETERLERIARHFAAWGEIFRIVTDTDIAALGETVGNLRYLAQWRSVSVPEAISRALPASAQVRELEAMIGLEHAWGAIADGWFTFDWRQPLTRNTQLLRSRERVWYEPGFLRT
ncbi:hypothetical protein ACPWT1_03965 [Ramlibacter sp. MMS24-I3-19]|uniref:hypothetical protein n=1 Tax=Ramlibacter sp. MMS24-I3-19 TaxID=3416606 RepID=UPI003D0504A7